MTLQERLRTETWSGFQRLAEEAADRIDLDAAHIDTLAKVVDKLQTERDALRHRNLLLLADRYQHSHGSFCAKLDQILEESK